LDGADFLPAFARILPSFQRCVILSGVLCREGSAVGFQLDT
jgi:hypothetical protein